MTIHSSHPFEPDETDRDPIRRFRGRLGGAVSLWTAGEGRERAGLTVTSMLVAAGDPARVVVLLHPDADLLERVEETSAAVVSLLTWRHRELADVFAGRFPAPGGPFRVGEWEQTQWGPRLVSAPSWLGVRADARSRRDVGWSVLLEAVVEHVELGEGAPDAGDAGDTESSAPLFHRRGRYLRL
ncbi:MAG TPA: flavin reductase family protein [Intrasporangium sp.]|uniref:flavin reductase family protein n=1 Tax=Intrasporangium sp. TaxID=1925024 RepID=UPI002B45ABE1|nr:flavin reductase family protein [Intrasporangium sp.]HKX68014.1 flavin reductase family protein [Intrasporangium sp.]